jgi:hypothetical protein
LPEFAQQIQTTIDPTEVSETAQTITRLYNLFILKHDKCIFKYDPITQMTLLSDISCALAYLHTITEQKDKILHGNLTPYDLEFSLIYSLRIKRKLY